MLTALITGRDTADRTRVAALLAAAGWSVREAAGIRESLALARSTDLDLVVADLDLPGGDGPALLRRLRLAGCRAHLVATTQGVTADMREAASAAGVLAVLPAPVDPGVLLRFLLGRLSDGRSRAHTVDPVDDDGLDDHLDDHVEDDLTGRLREMYSRALPARLSAIDSGARAGDAPALASASTTLAGTSAQLGYPEIADLCRAIASDARRGVLAHELVDRLLARATG